MVLCNNYLQVKLDLFNNTNMSRKITDILIDKSISALISCIEIYNKPDFKYREENFVILLINAWELLLKAKIIEDNGGKKQVIYVKEYDNKKDGTKSKTWRYKTTESGGYHTINIIKSLKLIKERDLLEPQIEANIESLIEIRNTSVHYYNVSMDYVRVIHEIGSASIYAYIEYLYEWFSKRLDQYNLYLLPISFFKSSVIESAPIYKHENELLKYISDQQKKYPYKESEKLHYAIYIKISFTKKSNGTAGVFLTNDPSAPRVQLSNEELAERYPLEHKDLVDKCKDRYSNFSYNTQFHKIKSKYWNNLKYCYPIYPTLKNTGNPRRAYSSAMLNILDKYYTKK